MPPKTPQARARARFVEIAEGRDADLNLAEASLLIGAEDAPDPVTGLDIPSQLRMFDVLAQRVRPRIEAAKDVRQQFVELVAYCANDLGLRGNSDDYYDPANSLVHLVLRRRKGIPISLSVIAIEIGRRAGLPLEGIGFPGHFLVGHQDLPGSYADMFHGGQLLDRRDCETMLDDMSNGSMPMLAQMLEPITTRAILVRMLTNLKGCYLRKRQSKRAIAAIDRLLLLQPSALAHLRDRGLIHLHAHAYREALEDLHLYLEVHPQAEDRGMVEAQMGVALARLRQLN
ncbi:MAG: SirB1 family protein [Nannocystaceae bacterium]